MAETQIPELRGTYEAAISYIDEQMSVLLAELSARDALENTLVIITSDHGEHFGEHGGLVDHANSLYMPLLHVPLLILHPGNAYAGIRIAEPVSLRSLPATVLDLVKAPLPLTMDSGSLASLWQGEIGRAKPVLSELETFPGLPARWRNSTGSLRSLISGDLHYVTNIETGQEELYNMATDPTEEVDLASNKDTAHLLIDMRLHLLNI